MVVRPSLSGPPEARNIKVLHPSAQQLQHGRSKVRIGAMEVIRAWITAMIWADACSEDVGPAGQRHRRFAIDEWGRWRPLTQDVPFLPRITQI